MWAVVNRTLLCMCMVTFSPHLSGASDVLFLLEIWSQLFLELCSPTTHKTILVDFEVYVSCSL